MRNSDKNIQIGGEFELEKSFINKNTSDKFSYLTNFENWTINGRSALYLILKKLKNLGISHIYLPAFLCESIIQPIKVLKLNYSFYSINANFEPDINPKKNSAVLLIHYFGFSNKNVKELRNESGKNFYLIEDLSHTFLNNDYETNPKNYFNYFSIRKHGPFSMGGWSNTKCEPDNISNSIIKVAKDSYKLRQLKKVYLDKLIYKNHENHFLKKFYEFENIMNEEIHPFALPSFLKELIDLYDWEKVINIRRSNWKTLDNLIGKKIKKITKDINESCVPLGYIINLKNRDEVRKKLIEKRIFTSIHWPLPNEIDTKNFYFEKKLSENILTLPIDQRYNEKHMNYLAETINKLI